MFIGEFYHSLDEKGRVNFPAKLREELGEQFVITKGLDGCLSAYSMEIWEHISKIVEGLPQAKARNLKRFMFSSATVVNPDKQGRVLVVLNLREFAGITKDIANARDEFGVNEEIVSDEFGAERVSGHQNEFREIAGLRGNVGCWHIMESSCY